MSSPEVKLSYGQYLTTIVITGILTGVTAISAAGFANAGQRANDLEQLELAQKASAYSAFIGATEDLLRAERNASMLFEPRQTPPTQGDGQDEIDALGDVNVKLQAAAATVILHAPDQVDASTTAIVKKMEALSDVYFRGFSKLNPTPTPDVIAAVKAEGYPLFKEYYTLKEEFLKTSAHSLDPDAVAVPTATGTATSSVTP